MVKPRRERVPRLVEREPDEQRLNAVSALLFSRRPCTLGLSCNRARIERRVRVTSEHELISAAALAEGRQGRKQRGRDESLAAPRARLRRDRTRLVVPPALDAERSRVEVDIA